MKKLSKFIYFILAFALITCMAIFNPAITMVDADVTLPNGEGFAFSTTKIAGNVKDGSEFKIPMPDVSDRSATQSIEVKDRNGSTHTYEIGEEYTGTYFELYDKDGNILTGDSEDASKVSYIKPAIVGKGSYTVKYKAVLGNKTYYSNAQTVQVEGVTYSWQFNEENTKKNIIPSVTASGTTYTLPLPKIVDSDDNTVATFTDASNIVITKNGEAVDLNGEDGIFAYDATTGVKFTPTLASGETTTTYVIKYKSIEPSLADRKYTVKVESGYNNTAELEVKHNSITNAQVENQTTLPTPNVTDKTHNKSSVEVNTYITIKGEDFEVELKANEFNYTFEKTGTHTIYYRVVDAYGNEATSAGYSFSVNDREPYIYDYAEDYDTEADNWEDKVVTGNTYAIPNQVGFSGFTLPAIYGKDYKDSYSELRFKRILEDKDDKTKYYDLDKATGEHGNGALTEDNTDYSKAIYFEFPEEDASIHAGKTYKLKYSVTDTNGNEMFATVYEIKVSNVDAEAYNLDKGLSIHFPVITESLDPQSEFSFTTATAKENPTDDTLVADERVEVRTFYYYGNKAVVEQALDDYIAEFKTNNTNYNEKYAYNFEDFYTSFNNTNKLYTLNSKNGKTNIKLEDYDADKDTVTIFAVGINDQQQFVIKAQELNVKNTTHDFTAPTIQSVSFSGGTFMQHDNINLGTVKFADAEDTTLKVTVTCYVDTPDQTVGVTINDFIGNGIGNIDIYAQYAGTYYVTYTATDDAGNTTTYISTFDVIKNSPASIKADVSSTSILVGEEVTFLPRLEGDGEYTDIAYTITWGNEKPSGSGSNQYGYTFDKAGTYTATISATYTMGGNQGLKAEPSVTVTIKVSEPTMSWDSDVETLITTDRTADINEEIKLPVVYAKEGNEMVRAIPKVTRKDDNGKDVEVTVNNSDVNYYYFVADVNGIYTVTYTADTKYATTNTTKSFTVTCGDYYAPTVTIDNNKLQDSEITYNGNDINLKTSIAQAKDDNGVKIAGKYILTVTATEGETQLFTYDINVSFRDKDEDKNWADLTTSDYTISLSGDHQSSNGGNNWTISGIGNYELKLTVKDENGNTSEAKTITFKVVDKKTEPKKNNDNVVGIVLIIVSAVILVGVILFFAFAGKRNKPRKKLAKAQKTENKD